MRLSTEDGRDLTPRGARARGVLALLALSPGHSRPRRWLEDKLWSSRGATQASASLRQSLSEIRRALGEAHAGLLEADRDNVTLVPARLRVVLDPPGEAAPGDHDLLEGLDIRDPEFEDWLRLQRTRLRPGGTGILQETLSQGLMLRCRSDVHSSSVSGLIGDILSNQIGGSVAEVVRAMRRSPAHQEAGSALASDIEIGCDVFESGGSSTVFIKIVHLGSGHILYSKVHPIDRPAEQLTQDEGLAGIVFEAADRVMDKLPLVIDKARPEARATALARKALYKMFSFEAPALQEADRLMEEAYRTDANGVYLAWRSLIRTVQFIELFTDDPEALQDEARSLNAAAIQQAGDNPLVLALVSLGRVMVFGDGAGGLDLAERAISGNPASAFAWQAMAAAQSLSGDPREAYQLSTHARRIAWNSPFRQWWDLYHCIVCVASGHHGEAIAAGEAAARAAPSFRPAHRHLLALYASDGRVDEALGAARALARIEPGFSIDRMRRDDDYPVRTLRNSGVLGALDKL